MFISLKDSRQKVEVLGTEAQVWWALQYLAFSWPILIQIIKNQRDQLVIFEAATFAGATSLGMNVRTIFRYFTWVSPLHTSSPRHLFDAFSYFADFRLFSVCRPLIVTCWSSSRAHKHHLLSCKTKQHFLSFFSSCICIIASRQ